MANITDTIETKLQTMEDQTGTPTIFFRDIVKDLIALVKDLDERLKKLE